MTEKLFTADERKKFEELAHRRGFTTLRDYVKTLIQKDTEQNGGVDDDLGAPTENFKRGWSQAMSGEVLTEEEFWKAVAEDD